MKLFNRKSGVLALAAATAMAVAGAGAGSAQAALPGHCAATAGTTAAGEGSSLQGVAQGIWTTQFNVSALGCTSAQERARYTATSSGRCLAKWGSAGGTFDRTVQFCGTDDPPDTTQLSNMRTSSGANVITVPVAQTSIAVIVNLPSGCTISSLSWADLESIWDGTITNWRTLSGASPRTAGSACDATITRVVRADSSGTTFQFKHFLSVTDSTTWTPYLDPSRNTNWPSTVTPSRSGATAPSTCGTGVGSGGGDEVKTVACTASSIGYAALPDARNAYIAGFTGLSWLNIAPLSSGGTARSPSTTGAISTTRANANCTTAASGGYSPIPTVTTDTWVTTFPVANSSVYPICTLTYVTALDSFTAAFGGTNGPNYGQTVKDYLQYILGGNTATVAGGQVDALQSRNDYQILPQDVRRQAWTNTGAIVS